MSRAKARQDGEGSIFESGGYWVASVSTKDPATGQRRQRRVKCRTRREARAALADLTARAAADQPLRDSTVTLAAWSQQWERTTLAASRRRTSTQETYASLAKSCIRPYLGGMALADIRPSDLDGWLHALAVKGLSDSTRRQALTVLRACLEAAVRDRVIAANPARLVERPALRRTEALHYSADDVRALLGHADGHRLRPLLVVLLGTGIRRGEALALQWENVDIDLAEIRVRGTLVRTSAGLVIHEPKTRNGWRTVPLSPPVLAALAEQRQAQRRERLKAGPSWIGSGHVFATEAGTPLEPRNVGRWFTGLAGKAGVGGSLHTLRHTALTSMAVSGVPLLVVSRLAGHESIAITADLYGHVTEQVARDAVASSAGALGLG